MRIITLSREFGSGGRELGKRLADYLGFAYYDKEILTAVAQQGNLDEGYVERLLENGPQRSFPITYGRTLSIRHQQDTTNLLVLQQKVLKAMAAKGDCVIGPQCGHDFTGLQAVQSFCLCGHGVKAETLPFLC